jgi:hypothetical protein
MLRLLDWALMYVTSLPERFTIVMKQIVGM